MTPMGPRPAPPSDEVLARVHELGQAGLILQAYRAAVSHAPLRDWTGSEGRLLAAQIAQDVGAPGLARAIVRLGRRETPGDPMLLARRVEDLADEGRPLAALDLLEAREGQVVATDEGRAYLGIVRALLLARFRDFDRAHRFLEEAARARPDHPSLGVSRAWVLTLEDRFEEAAAQIQEVLSACPTLIQAIDLLARLHQARGLDEEAARVLEKAVGRLESARLAFHLAAIRSEQGDFDGLERTLERYEALSPLLEKGERRRLAAFRADIAWARGDYRAAAELAEASRSPFHLALAARLKDSPPAGKRVLLPVGFVRQHHLTCVPATLATIADYWEMPAEHLKIAEEICYNGTTAQAERAWAESHGWIAREFTVSWDSARALLDRGVPFTLSTRRGLVGHLQAVIGCDPMRGTLFLRDSNVRHHLEVIAGPFLEDQAAAGPRGMALVPSPRGDLLKGLELPDAPLHDRLFRLESALRRFDREQALPELQALESEAPEHRLALLARFSLAAFDGDPAARLAALERWIRLFPGDGAIRLRHLDCLEGLGREEEMRDRLRDLLNLNPADAALCLRLGRWLGRDARNRENALRWIRLAERMEPAEPGTYLALGEVTSRVDGQDRALEYYRLAACLGDRDEGMASSYFACARLARRTEEALAFLEERLRRLGALSPAPAVTLARALIALDRDARGLEVLESALDLHRDDGQLLLIAAQAMQEYGRTEAARILLERARGKCPEAAFETHRGRLALLQGDREGAREVWERLVARDPLSMEGHAALARLIGAAAGPHAVLRHLAEAAARAPRHPGLKRLELDWARNCRPDRMEGLARTLVEISPDDAGARFEWCDALENQCREAEAIEQARAALAIAPGFPQAMVVLGRLLALAGREDDARRLLRRALGISPDLPDAIHLLVFNVAETVEERRSALSELSDTFLATPGSGEGLRTMLAVAEEVWTPDELRNFTDRILEARPDFPAVWSASFRQLLARGERTEALAAAGEAAKRFPLCPGSWFDLAQACDAAGDRGGEMEALRRALQIRPAWRQAIRALARALLQEGRREEALAELRREFPTELPDPGHEAEAGSILWSAGLREEGLERLRRFLRLVPRDEGAWKLLAEQSAELKQGQGAEGLAREMVTERPDDPAAWLALAVALRNSGQIPRALDAIWKVQEIDPHDLRAHDLGVEILVQAGLFDQALAACRPDAWGDSPPLALRGRRAWVLWKQGEREAAVREMRDLLGRHPSYAWGWAHLTLWSLQRDDPEDYATAAQRWVWLDPRNSFALIHRGQSLLRQGRREEGKASLRRSMQLAPHLEEPASHLFQAEIEDGDLEAAESLIRATEKVSPDDLTLARRTRLSCARGDTASAVEAVDALCRLPSIDWPRLTYALGALLAAHLEPQVLSSLQGALHAPAPSPCVPVAWINLTLRRKEDYPRCLEGLRGLSPSTGAWPVGASHLLEKLSQLGAWGHLGHFVAEHRTELLARNETWLAVLSCLIRRGYYRAARDWAADWESRGEMPAEAYWMVSLAFRACLEGATAARVTRRAVEELRLSHESLRAWSLFDRTMQGEAIDEATIAGIEKGTLKAPDAFLVGLARALRAVGGDSGEIPQGGFGRARRFLRAAEKRYPRYPADPLCSRARKQALGRLAAARGRWLAVLWRRWRPLGRKS